MGEGYVQIRIGRGRNAKRVLEHRLVMERKLGRKLRPGETVHHINHDRSDNREENLRLYDNPGIHVIAEGHVSRRRDGTFGPPRNFSRKTTGEVYERKEHLPEPQKKGAA